MRQILAFVNNRGLWRQNMKVCLLLSCKISSIQTNLCTQLHQFLLFTFDKAQNLDAVYNFMQCPEPLRSSWTACEFRATARITSSPSCACARCAPRAASLKASAPSQLTRCEYLAEFDTSRTSTATPWSGYDVSSRCIWTSLPSKWYVHARRFLCFSYFILQSHDL